MGALQTVAWFDERSGIPDRVRDGEGGAFRRPRRSLCGRRDVGCGGGGV